MKKNEEKLKKLTYGPNNVTHVVWARSHCRCHVRRVFYSLQPIYRIK